jgi:hypothetical protein
MRRAPTPGSRVAVLAAHPAMGESRLADEWRRLIKYLFDPFRAELHYMRGPGPKWREKRRITDQPRRYGPRQTALMPRFFPGSALKMTVLAR